jgi:hypothetical protein
MSKKIYKLRKSHIQILSELSAMKSITVLISTLLIHFYASGQILTGDGINSYGTSGTSDYIIQNSGNIESGYANTSSGPVIFSTTQSGGSYTSNTFITAESTGLSGGSSESVSLYVGTIDSATSSLTETSGLALSTTYNGVYSVGTSSYSYLAWAPSTSELSTTSTTANGFYANSSGAYIQSASDLTLTGTTITLTGTTNINTTGNYSTSIGSSGTGSVTMTSGTNSVALSNTLLTITAPTTIVGTTNINATGTASTSIGNTTGTVTIVGSTVNVGTNSGSAVTVGNSSANSTVSLNGNRLQNVGTGTSGTDAVNLTQVNSLISSTTSQITSLQNQIYTNERGISGASAMTNIPSLQTSQQYNFGVGIGSFEGTTALALGGNFRLRDNLVGKISASISSGTYVTGAGISLGW